MRQYPIMNKYIKCILSFFAATIVCTVFFSFRASAVNWSSLVDPTHDDIINVTSPTTIDFSGLNKEVFVRIYNGTTLTIEPGTYNLSYSIDFSYSSNGAKIEWHNANFNLSNDSDLFFTNVYEAGYYKYSNLTLNMTSSNIISNSRHNLLSFDPNININISNGTISNQASAIVIDSNSPAVLTNVTVSSAGSIGVGTIVTQSNLTMTGGSVTTTGGGGYAIYAGKFNGTSFQLSGVVVQATNSDAHTIIIVGSQADVVISDTAIHKIGGTGDALYIGPAKSLSISASASTCTNGNTGSALNLSNVTNGTTINYATISNVSASAPAIVSANNLTITDYRTTITSTNSTAIQQTGGALSITDARVEGKTGVSATGLTSIALNSGTIGATGTDISSNAAVLVAGTTATAVTLSGANLQGGSNLSGVMLGNPNATFSMTDGSITGKRGIYATAAASIGLTAGSVTATYGDSSDAAVYVQGTSTTPVTIGGATISGGTNGYGVTLANSNASLSISGLAVSGKRAVNATAAKSIDITGGTLTGTSALSSDAVLYVTGATPVTVSGGTISTEFIEDGIRLNNSGATLSMTGGNVLSLGGSGILGDSFNTIDVSGGTVASTGTSYNAGILTNGGSKLTVHGGSQITGYGSGGSGIKSSTPSVIIAGSPQISGAAYGLQLTVSSSALINGGFLSGSGDGSFGLAGAGSATIQPTDTTPVTIRGKESAIGNIAHTLNNVINYYPSEDYDNDGVALYLIDNPYSYNSNWKRVKYIDTYINSALKVIGGTADVHTHPVEIREGTQINVTATPQGDKIFGGWDAIGITLPDPMLLNLTFSMPANDVTLTAIYNDPPPKPVVPENPSGSGDIVYHDPVGYEFTDTDNPRVLIYSVDLPRAEYVLVIATLNPSGSVNSDKTAEDIRKAHVFAEQIRASKILLEIPAKGTSISKFAMQKCLKAASGTAMYLTYDFHTTVKGEYLGNMFIPLSGKSGQYLTKIYFNTTRIESVQKYIKEHYKTQILGSFETEQKGGFGEASTIKVNLEKLGFTADDGERLHALIYDTEAKKWYQAAATVDEGDIVIKTDRTGIFTIITDTVM